MSSKPTSSDYKKWNRNVKSFRITDVTTLKKISAHMDWLKQHVNKELRTTEGQLYAQAVCRFIQTIIEADKQSHLARQASLKAE